MARFACAEAAHSGLAAARLLDKAGEEWEAAQACITAQVGLVHAGRFAEADSLTESLLGSVRRVGHPSVDLWVLRNTATMALLRTGDLKAYAAFAEQYLHRCQTLGLRWQSDAETMVGMTAFWRGDWDTAATHLKKGALLEPVVKPQQGRNQAALLRFDAYAGRKNAVRERWDRYRAARACGLCQLMGDRQMAVAGAEAWAAIGVPAKAAQLYPQITDAIADGALIAVTNLRLLATAAGISAAAAGNWELAEAHFAEALEQADTLPHLLEQPEARRLWAEALLNRRNPADTTRARELLTEALNTYRRLGMPRHAALTEAHLDYC
jgi:tetratricopeptide (TPR) repeat protein